MPHTLILIVGNDAYKLVIVYMCFLDLLWLKRNKARAFICSCSCLIALKRGTPFSDLQRANALAYAILFGYWLAAASWAARICMMRVALQFHKLIFVQLERV